MLLVALLEEVRNFARCIAYGSDGEARDFFFEYTRSLKVEIQDAILQFLRFARPNAFELILDDLTAFVFEDAGLNPRLT